MGQYSSKDLYEDSLRRKLAGTCGWLLDSPTFREWLLLDNTAGAAKFLWLHGPAGYGKTVLCSTVIEYLTSTSTAPVAYFFLSSESESRDDPYLAVRSWIAQVISSDSKAFAVARDEWHDQHEQLASRATITNLFREILHVIPNYTFVLDGLDECSWMGQNHNQSSILKEFVELILHTTTDTPARVMIFSRDEPEIRQTLQGQGCTEITLSVENVGPDVSLYARSIVGMKLPKKDEPTKDDLARRMADRCKGQFIWLRMQQGSLRGSKNKRQLEAIIDEAPSGLEKLYERNWERIQRLANRDRVRAMALLRWAAFALRPLTVLEITEAVLVDEDRSEFPVEELPDVIDDDYVHDEILGVCGSLLEVKLGLASSTPASQTVHIAHFSVRQYLLTICLDQGRALGANERLRSSSESSENIRLAELCLAYMNYNWTWNARQRADETLPTPAFLNYAAVAWCRHALTHSADDVRLIKLMTALFDKRNPRWHQWAQEFQKSHGAISKTATRFSPPATPLFYASGFGLEILAKHLIDQSPNTVNLPSRSGATPLGVACMNGRVKIADMLLAAGADIDARDKAGNAPIHVTCRSGSKQLLALLIEKGANLTVTNNAGLRPINLATLMGHVELVRLLIDHGVDVMTPGSFGETPLHFASFRGYTDTVKILLENGADPSALDGRHRTPLNIASDCGHAEIVQILLEKGGYISTPDEIGSTPLHSASRNGNLQAVKDLLGNGADIAVQTMQGLTPLHIASEHGRVDLVKLLLDNGADIAAGDTTKATPLGSACKGGHIAVAELLLDHGCDINARDVDGNTPLVVASENGHAEVVKLLLDRGADVTVGDTDGDTPLALAAMAGHLGVVKLLLARGADMTAQDVEGDTPLALACMQGHTEVVRLLHENGAEMTTPNFPDRAPLLAAAEYGHIDIVKFLLDNGAGTTIRVSRERTPLGLAAQGGHADVVELLFDHGADITVPDLDGDTPLHLACMEGHFDVVKFLLDKGSDITRKNDKGRSPLYLASSSGNTDTTKLLLERGAELARDKTGWTPLHIASLEGHLDVARLLVQSWPELTFAQDRIGRTPLFVAAADGPCTVVEFLMNSDSSMVHVQDRYGITPLFAAAKGGHDESIKLLAANQQSTMGLDKLEDGFGRNLQWWSRIVETGGPGSQFPRDTEFEPINVLNWYCEACFLRSQRGGLFACGTCYEFYLCIECFDLGLRCFVDSHQFTLKRTESHFLESATPPP